MEKKKIIAINIIGAAVILAIILIRVFTHHKDDPNIRSIRVVDMDGACSVERNGNEIVASKGMLLFNGDIFIVSDSGHARLSIDDNKLLYLDTGARLGITATGDTETIHTSLFLYNGAMMTEVLEKLTPESYFTVATANTVMSIKGTKTLTQVDINPVTGETRTSSAVIEGIVTMRAVPREQMVQ